MLKRDDKHFLDNVPDKMELDEAIIMLKDLNKKVRKEFNLYNMSSKTYCNILRIRKIIEMLDVPKKMEVL